MKAEYAVKRTKKDGKTLYALADFAEQINPTVIASYYGRRLAQKAGVKKVVIYDPHPTSFVTKKALTKIWAQAKDPEKTVKEALEAKRTVPNEDEKVSILFAYPVPTLLGTVQKSAKTSKRIMAQLKKRAKANHQSVGQFVSSQLKETYENILGLNDKTEGGEHTIEEVAEWDTLDDKPEIPDILFWADWTVINKEGWSKEMDSLDDWIDKFETLISVEQIDLPDDEYDKGIEATIGMKDGFKAVLKLKKPVEELFTGLMLYYLLNTGKWKQDYDSSWDGEKFEILNPFVVHPNYWRAVIGKDGKLQRYIHDGGYRWIEPMNDEDRWDAGTLLKHFFNLK